MEPYTRNGGIIGKTMDFDATDFYQITQGWDVSTSTFVQSFSVSSQETIPTGVFLKYDGLKMYVIGADSDLVNEYTLSTAWDLSTATFSQSFSVSSQETGPSGIFFKPDGLKMYVIGTAGDDVNEYNLSVAWDVSTATFSQNFSVATEETVPRDIYFSPDGIKMYITGTVGDDVNEYTLSTAWDVSTATYVQNFSVSTQESVPLGIFFKSDGTKMYITGNASDSINEYTLSTAWNLSTATFSQSVNIGSQEAFPRGVFFSSDGIKMYVTGSSGDDVNEYTLDSALINGNKKNSGIWDLQSVYNFRTL